MPGGPSEPQRALSKEVACCACIACFLGVQVQELPVPIYGAPYSSQPLWLWAPIVQTGTVVLYLLEIQLSTFTQYHTCTVKVQSYLAGTVKSQHVTPLTATQIRLVFNFVDGRSRIFLLERGWWVSRTHIPDQTRLLPMNAVRR